MIKVKRIFVLSALIGLSLCMLAVPLQARATTNLDGVTWDGDVAHVTVMVDGALLKTELASHQKTSGVTGVAFEANSGISNTCASLFANLDKLEYVKFDDSFMLDSGVVFLQNMFNGCHSLKEITLPSGFATSQVTNMESMFKDCYAITSITFPMTFVTDSIQEGATSGIDSMFGNCGNLETLNLGGFTVITKAGKRLITNLDFLKFDYDAMMFTGYCDKISTVTCVNGCTFEPSRLDIFPTDDIMIISGSYFNYPGKSEKGWNAYNKDYELVALNMTTQLEFEKCQKENPGTLTYVWVDGPQPEPPAPEPDPTPAPAPEQPTAWEQSDTGWRLLVDGEPASGWVWVADEYGEHWYFCGDDGYVETNTWLWDDAQEAWYWLCSSGSMIQGLWQWIDNAWYGFDWNGQMCKGWVWDADWVCWFYCYDNGVMARNAWVDGYYLNNSGFWVH